ncbi:MAG: hypothetical protein JO182_05485 [Acidobacteriaceae bacterium]|nr:hypothetical protein [Acidobacteriaceae bacterium]
MRAINSSSPAPSVRKTLAAALVIFPGLFILVFLLHFHKLTNFFRFRKQYVPPPDHVLAALVYGHNRWPLLHDPHMIAYLGLPVLLLCAFALYLLGREVRSMASAVALMITSPVLFTWEGCSVCG